MTVKVTHFSYSWSDDGLFLALDCEDGFRENFTITLSLEQMITLGGSAITRALRLMDAQRHRLQSLSARLAKYEELYGPIENTETPR